MKPSTNSIPFATSVLPQPIIDKLERGWRDLEVNYNLRGLLRRMEYSTPSGITFALYVVPDKASDVLEEINRGLKPFVMVTNRTWAGLNKFLTACGTAIARKYGTAETKQRKTA